MNPVELILIAFGTAAAMMIWPILSRRLPGAHGNALSDSVEIVPTVNLWLQAVLMPIASVGLLVLGIVALYGLPDFRTLPTAIAMLLWLGGLALGISAIAKIVAVRRHKVRYDSSSLSYYDCAERGRRTVLFDDVDRVEERWFGADRLHLDQRSIPFARDAGGSDQLIDFLTHKKLNP